MRWFNIEPFQERPKADWYRILKLLIYALRH